MTINLLYISSPKTEKIHYFSLHIHECDLHLANVISLGLGTHLFIHRCVLPV